MLANWPKSAILLQKKNSPPVADSFEAIIS